MQGGTGIFKFKPAITTTENMQRGDITGLRVKLARHSTRGVSTHRRRHHRMTVLSGGGRTLSGILRSGATSIRPSTGTISNGSEVWSSFQPIVGNFIDVHFAVRGEGMSG